MVRLMPKYLRKAKTIDFSIVFFYSNIMTQKYIAFIQSKKQKHQIQEIANIEHLEFKPRYSFLDFIYELDNVTKDTALSSDLAVYPEPEQWDKSDTFNDETLLMLTRYGGCNLIAEIMTGIFNKNAYMVYHTYPYYDDSEIPVAEAKADFNAHNWQAEGYSQPVQHIYFLDDENNICDLANTFNHYDLEHSPLYDEPSEYDDFDPLETRELTHQELQAINKDSMQYATNQWTDLVESGLAIQIIDYIVKYLSKNKPWISNGEF